MKQGTLTYELNRGRAVKTSYFFRNDNYTAVEVGAVIMLDKGQSFTAANGDTFTRIK